MGSSTDFHKFVKGLLHIHISDVYFGCIAIRGRSFLFIVEDFVLKMLLTMRTQLDRTVQSVFMWIFVLLATILIVLTKIYFVEFSYGNIFKGQKEESFHALFD